MDDIDIEDFNLDPATQTPEEKQVLDEYLQYMEESTNPHMPQTMSKKTKNNKKKRSRNYCFTDHKMEDIEAYKNIKNCRYILIGKEVGKKTEKTHWQGFIQFETQTTFKAVKKRLPDGVHIEACVGTAKQNQKYCKKEGNILLEEGEMKTQGQRTDLKEVFEKIKKNVPMIQIAEEYPGDFVRYHGGFKEYRRLVQKENTKGFRKIDVEFICGPTGCGKTRYAVEACGDTEFFKIEGSELKWWDGYEGQPNLIIDEYANDIKITKMLNILDGYQLRLPVKGSFTYAAWTKVFITSNLKPRQLHLNARVEHILALKRRITTVKNYFTEDEEDDDDDEISIQSQCGGNTSATFGG